MFLAITTYYLFLIKNFVRAVDQNGSRFPCLKRKFPRIGKTRIKEGLFVDLQIGGSFNWSQELLQDHLKQLPHISSETSRQKITSQLVKNFCMPKIKS
jgi:hypothetical protein